jgi:Putative Flp pilus-assembly TadE/G-like
MRRLTQLHRDDGGVGTIFIVLAMLAVLVGVAFAIDVGRYVAEARSAQNSADATVLAVATDCARSGSPIADYSPYRKSDQSITTPACGSGEATITVTTPISDGILLKQSAGDVDRSATARWGTIGSAKTTPLTISACEYSLALLNGPTDVIFYMADRTPHASCPGGNDQPPGGFGWLDQTNCEVTTSVSNTVPGSNGASSHGAEGCVIALMGKEILVPIFQGFSGSGSHADYTIVGYATIKLTGYSFNGNDNDGLPKKCPEWKDRGNFCIQGDFVRFSTQAGTPGPSPDMGSYSVYLSS